MPVDVPRTGCLLTSPEASFRGRGVRRSRISGLTGKQGLRCAVTAWRNLRCPGAAHPPNVTSSRDIADPAKFEPTLDKLLALYPDALDRGVMPPARSTHRVSSLLAHGWYMRSHRTAQALVLLEKAGFNGEAAPLRRSITEHSVALVWLAEEGDRILATLAGGHAFSVGKHRQALEDAQWTEHDLEELAAIETQIMEDASRDRSNDRLLRYKELHAAYGADDQLVSWLAETFRSHATFQSANDYLEPDTRALAQKSLVEVSGTVIATIELLRATLAFSDVFDPSPWERELQEAYGEVEAADD